MVIDGFAFVLTTIMKMTDSDLRHNRASLGHCQYEHILTLM